MSTHHGVNFIVTPKDSLNRVKFIGGKARNLYYMSAAGVKVPKWVCLSTEAYDAYLAPILDQISNIISQIEPEQIDAFKQASTKIAALIQSIEMSSDIANSVLEKLGTENLLAVRSSANSEDGPNFSFAGQLESFLFVGGDQLTDKIKDCWCSGFSPRILQYMHINNIDIQSFKVAVIFQHMVNSHKSGVLFTINPLAIENFTSQVVITAGYGIGEGIVRDLVETDTYIFDQKIEKIVDANYSEKKRQLVLNEKEGRGLLEVDVPSNLKNASVLTQGQVEKLVGIGKQLRRFHGQEQDVEWAIDHEGSIFITQCRPITSIGKNLAGHDFFLDNSNIVESFPGNNTPWTISQVREVYARVFADAAKRLGISSSSINQKRYVFDHLIATHQGRMYYNLTHWYEMMRLVPYTESYIQVWEEMLGVEKNIHSHLGMSLSQRMIQRPWQLAKTASLLIYNLLVLNLSLKSLDRQLRKTFDVFWQEHQRGHFYGLKPHEIISYLNRFKAQCFHRWDLTLLNDIYAFVWTAVTKKLIAKWVDEEQGEKLFNDLLLGENAMDSVLPIKSILSMAMIVGKNPELEEKIKAMIRLGEVKTDLLKSNNEEMNFRHLFNEHIEQYGDRGVDELKLETLTFRENPVILLQMILDYIPTAMAKGENPQEASSSVFEIIDNKLATSKVKKSLFNLVLKLAKRSINYRENFRLHRSRAYGIVRRISLILGSRLRELDAIDEERDIFYLEQRDVENYAFALAFEENLRDKVKLNRKQYFHNAAQMPTGKLQFGKLRFEPVLENVRLDQGIEEIKGQPCSSGIIEGEALVLESVELQIQDTSNLDGKILVAPMTDPGWVFIMTVSKGLIVEKGSILSHTAIIGRELGIPTIVGVQAATKLIKNGDWIRMDGTRGIIQILKRRNHE